MRQCRKEVLYFRCRGDKSQTQEVDQGGKEREKRKPEEGREKGKTKEPTKRLQEKLASTFSGTEDEKKADLKKSQVVEGVYDCGAKRLEIVS